jgi:hypothetical protein
MHEDGGIVREEAVVSGLHAKRREVNVARVTGMR